MDSGLICLREHSLNCLLVLREDTDPARVAWKVTPESKQNVTCDDR